MVYLDFEKPIAALEARILELQDAARESDVDVSAEISKLRDKADKQLDYLKQANSTDVACPRWKQELRFLWYEGQPRKNCLARTVRNRDQALLVTLALDDDERLVRKYRISRQCHQFGCAQA